MKSRSGFSLTEIIMSVLLVSIIGLGLADFSANFFNVSYVHAQKLENINFTRYTAEHIAEEIAKSEYIYPSGITISLDDTNIDTSGAIALLIPEDKVNLDYRFTAFYIDSGNLIEFHGSSPHNWTINAIPADTLTTFSGSSQIIASDIDTENSQLNYNLNYNNGITDIVLKGEIASVLENSSEALIKGIKWDITIDNVETEKITVYGVSNNVPRYVE